MSLAGVMLLGLAGCATVPMVVPQVLIDARTALGDAKKIEAYLPADEDYQTAGRLLELAEAAFAAEQSMTIVENLAFEAEAYARIAQAQARCRLAEQEYEDIKQALITRQKQLIGLAREEEIRRSVQHKVQPAKPDKKATTSMRAMVEHKAAMLSQARKIKDADVRAKAQGVVINFPGRVLFNTESSQLQTGAKAFLDEAAKVIKQFPDYHVRIEGHTDNTGDLLGNNTLSQAQAESVLAYLNRKGISLDKLAAVGMGPDRPIAANKTPEGRQLNRRLEIILEKKAD
jgi:outer membrane protein OmpA-like peptidoglycan-associated protein